MIKGSVYQENITIINTFAHNIGAPKYTRQILTDLQWEIDKNVIIERTSVPHFQYGIQFLYKKINELSEKEIKKTIPFTITPKRIKYLGINLTKEVKIYMLKTISHWWEKLKTTQIRGRYPMFCIRRINIVKMSIPPKEN